jgi:hypothetical protein
LNNSARFPGLEAAGELLHVETGEPPDPLAPGPTEIIDGGYFDNEGIVTARELADWLRNNSLTLIGREAEPILVQVTSDADPAIRPADVVRCDRSTQDDPTVSDGGSLQVEIIAALSGLNATRQAHSDWLLRETRDNYCEPKSKSKAFFHFYLHPWLDGIPLNWMLSEKTVKYIWDRAIGGQPDNANELGALRSVLRDPPKMSRLPDL